MSRKGIIKICLQCRASFYCYPYDTKKFCSHPCYVSHRKENGNRIIWHNITCKFCGKDKKFTGRFFNKKRQCCSKICADKLKTGKSVPNGLKISLALKGKPKSAEHIKKISEAKIGKPRPNMTGEKHPNWTGLTPLKELIRKSFSNKQWKISCFKRDRVCVFCGEKNNRKLEVDHIIPFSFIIKYFKIDTTEKAENCKLLWDIRNGRVLCDICHKKTSTYGELAKKYHLETNSPSFAFGSDTS